MAFTSLITNLVCSDCGNELRMCIPEDEENETLLHSKNSIGVIPCSKCNEKNEKLKQALKEVVEND